MRRVPGYTNKYVLYRHMLTGSRVFWKSLTQTCYSALCPVLIIRIWIPELSCSDSPPATWSLLKFWVSVYIKFTYNNCWGVLETSFQYATRSVLASQEYASMKQMVNILLWQKKEWILLWKALQVGFDIIILLYRDRKITYTDHDHPEGNYYVIIITSIEYNGKRGTHSQILSEIGI